MWKTGATKKSESERAIIRGITASIMPRRPLPDLDPEYQLVFDGARELATESIENEPGWLGGLHGNAPG